VHTIGTRLKAWREAKSLKQAEASQQLGLAGNTYQNYERDVRAPNTEGWAAFARAGINTNWLLTGEGPMMVAELEKPQRGDVSVQSQESSPGSSGYQVQRSKAGLSLRDSASLSPTENARTLEDTDVAAGRIEVSAVVGYGKTAAAFEGVLSLALALRLGRASQSQAEWAPPNLDLAGAEEIVHEACGLLYARHHDDPTTLAVLVNDEVALDSALRIAIVVLEAGRER
jgi:DNA-binding XRE family transcriptional regulator